ncbi:MAG TPA: hypothetical protein VF406_08165 [Thermodesulfobacteriota bacterium]
MRRPVVSALSLVSILAAFVLAASPAAGADAPRYGGTMVFGQPFTGFHPRTRLAFQNLAGIDTSDAHTVVVRFTKPYAPFLQQMTCQEGAMLPEHLYEGTGILDNPRNNDHPIGTDPFASWPASTTRRPARDTC